MQRELHDDHAIGFMIGYVLLETTSDAADGTRFTVVLHPLGASALLSAGPPSTLAFSVLHGAGNGILTITKETWLLALFGPPDYGFRQGV